MGPRSWHNKGVTIDRAMLSSIILISLQDLWCLFVLLLITPSWEACNSVFCFCISCCISSFKALSTSSLVWLISCAFKWHKRFHWHLMEPAFWGPQLPWMIPFHSFLLEYLLGVFHWSGFTSWVWNPYLYSLFIWNPWCLRGQRGQLEETRNCISKYCLIFDSKLTLHNRLNTLKRYNLVALTTLTASKPTRWSSHVTIP